MKHAKKQTKNLIIGLLLMICVTSCANNGARNNYCALSFEIKGNSKDADVISDILFNAIAKHNKIYDYKCRSASKL